MSNAMPTFSIGPIPVFGDLILAPMDGYSELPFRSLCREYGSSVSYTAFVNAIDILQESDSAWRSLRYLENERPVIFQIYDSDEDRLIQAALVIRSLEPDAIDINMGCSVRSVSGRGAGAGWLREPDKIERLLSRLVRELDLPVTAKIRLGWDDVNRNYLEVARAIEHSGASLIAVHGRTRQQGFRGEADWDAISEIKAAIRLPVIANGDVRIVEDIERIKAHTSCDGVMLGRAAMGNPWIFSRQARADVSRSDLTAAIQHHLSRMIEFHGQVDGLLRFRKHLKRYLLPQKLSVHDLTAILRSESLPVLLQQLEQVGLCLDLHAPDASLMVNGVPYSTYPRVEQLTTALTTKAGYNRGRRE